MYKVHWIIECNVGFWENKMLLVCLIVREIQYINFTCGKKRLVFHPNTISMCSWKMLNHINTVKPQHCKSNKSFTHSLSTKSSWGLFLSKETLTGLWGSWGSIPQPWGGETTPLPSEPCHTLHTEFRFQKADHKTKYTVLAYLPVRSSYMRIPKDQQSAPKSWPLFIMTSGATYSGVPQNVQVFFPRPIFFAKPKSACGNRKQKACQYWRN